MGISKGAWHHASNFEHGALRCRFRNTDVRVEGLCGGRLYLKTEGTVSQGAEWLGRLPPTLVKDCGPSYFDAHFNKMYDVIAICGTEK